MVRKIVLSCLIGMYLHLTMSSPVPTASLKRRCSNEDIDNCEQDVLSLDDLPFDNTDSISNNGVYLGMYPNPSETLCDLEGVVGDAFAFHGLRVELKSGQTWDGSELKAVETDLLKTKAVLQIAIIPDPSWWGLTKEEDCQALAIAKHIGSIRRAIGRPLCLTFAPEMNCMPTSPSGGGFKSEGPKLTFSLDNTKTVPFETPIPATETKSAIGFEPPIPAGKRGLKARSMPEPTAGTLKSLMERSAPTTSNDFVGAWNLVHEALKTEAPDTLMIWSPRPTDDTENYREFWPKDAEPDLVGLTYEPNQKVSVDGFLDTVQPFHDEFASSSRPFLLTQTAPKLNLSRKNRIKFLNIITHEQAVEALPYYFAAIYHNFKSEVDNRVIILPGEDGGSGTSMNKKMKKWVANAA